MKKILPIILLFFYCTLACSQVNKRKAFQKYKEAKNLYYEENYKKAIELFKESISELGETNIKIQSIYVKALYKNKSYPVLEKELPIYNELQKKYKIEKDPEIEELKKDFKEYTLKENKNYLYIQAASSVSNIEEFLIKYPNSKYTKNAEEMLLNAKDEKAWLNYLTIGTLSYLNYYIQNFENGKNIKDAKGIYNQMDSDAKNKANQQDTEKSYLVYLNTFENGKYREQIQQKYKIKFDNNLYRDASNVNTVASFEGYISVLPNGLNVTKANNNIEQIMYNKVKSLDKPYNYTSLKKSAIEFKEKFPNSSKTKEVNRLYKKSLRQLKRTNSGMLFLTYETNKSYGIQLGSLRSRAVGWYFSVRGNEDVIDASFHNEDMVTESQFNNLTEVKTLIGSATFGLNYPIAYPLYISAGAGVNFKQYANEDATIIFSLEDEKKYAIFPEVGLQAKLGPVIIGGGASYIREEIIYKMGIGFTF